MRTRRPPLCATGFLRPERVKQFTAMGAQATYVTAFAPDRQSAPGRKGDGVHVFPPHEARGRQVTKGGPQVYHQHDLNLPATAGPAGNDWARRQIPEGGGASSTSVRRRPRLWDCQPASRVWRWGTRGALQGGKPIIEHDLIGPSPRYVHPSAKLRDAALAAALGIDNG